MAEDQRTPAERLLRERLGEPGPELRRSDLQRKRTLEGYFAASAPPRWMERLSQIANGTKRAERHLAEAHARVRAESAGDPEAFARRWRATVAAWRFDEELNELIRQHNEWFPIERRLPVDPRTGEYQLVNGRSYRRPVLDAAWALERFPADGSPGG